MMSTAIELALAIWIACLWTRVTYLQDMVRGVTALKTAPMHIKMPCPLLNPANGESCFHPVGHDGACSWARLSVNTNAIRGEQYTWCAEHGRHYCPCRKNPVGLT